jgi:hypothetical protein
MILDSLLKVSASQALTATAVATNTYDQGAPYTSGGTNTEIGEGEPMGFLVNVEVAADFTTGDETYEFDVVSATAADGTTGQLIHLKMALLASYLVAGRNVFVPIPPGIITQRYITLKYILAGTTPTLTVSAYLVPAAQYESVKKYYSTASTTAA